MGVIGLFYALLHIVNIRLSVELYSSFLEEKMMVIKLPNISVHF